jgi:hypothetical protein
MAKTIDGPFSIDDLLPAIVSDVEDAVDFTLTEFDDDFEKAERYYNGEVDIPVEPGRSKVVSTQVRDAIRNFRPSALRVLASNRRKMVKYWPSNIRVAPVVEQQGAYVHQLFWKSDGYNMLYAALDETMKHRIGPIKTYWEENPNPKFARITYLTAEEVQAIGEMPDIEIKKVIPLPVSQDMPEGADLYTVECIQYAQNGRVRTVAVPYGEFFISRNATSCNDSRVHGHRRNVSVAEAIEMGLEYDDWWSLDSEDPDQARVSGTSEAKRGYVKEDSGDRGDELSHELLLTEAYVRMDLENVGYEQLYVVYLGGTSYEYLDHEQIDESPFDLARIDPTPFTPWGKSLADIAIPQQEVITSMLRGIVDNVHLANTPRLGGNPSQVNFDDLMSHEFGHPIRFKGSGTAVQVVQVPSQVQATLPVLQWLEQDAENKIGITKAAQGLDPSAMQSTDKQAVANTIQLAQGQVELAVRNFVETGLVGVFRKMLRLSIQHLDRMQIVKMRGDFIPVDQLLFDPDLYAEPQVGLGSVEDEKRMAGLQFTLQTQQGLYAQMGPDNPFVSASHIYNTLEDLTEEFGLTNVSRYYNLVTPEVEKQFAETRAQQAASMEQSKKGMDPAAAIVEAESIKSGTEKLKALARAQLETQQLALDVMKFNAEDDFRRDQLAQQRVVDFAKIAAQTGVKINEQNLKREQMEARDTAIQTPNTANTINGEQR